MKTTLFKWIGIVIVGTAGLAFTVDKTTNRVLWRFLKEPYRSNYDSAGIPKAFSERTPPSQAFLNRLSAALPERRDIRSTNPHLISDDFGANVHLTKPADLYVTFLHEGAGYKNSFGFFTFADDAIPQTKYDVREVIVFPNSSYYNSGGSSKGLKSGDTVHLGHFDAGTNVGFVVVANGFNSQTGVVTAPTGGPAGGDWVFYTIKHLNPEVGDPSLKAHTVLLHDAQTGLVVLGMEDIKRDVRGCDHDFNDIVFTVKSVPADAIDVSDLAPIPKPKDADGDGVLDENDDFPTDPGRAWEMKSHTAALAFEDSWPSHGDYDYNDVVIRHQYSRILNAAGQVVEARAHFDLLAYGTDQRLGFALAIPGIAASAVKQATLAVNGGAAVSVQSEAKQPSATYILFQDATALLPKAGACKHFNTDVGCDSGTGPSFDLVVQFKTPQTQSSVGMPPWDPFLFFTTQRGREVHLPDHPASALADTGLFLTADDDTTAATGRWYKSFCNLPWALDIPGDWAWPAEGHDILDAYPDFEGWAASLGTKNLTWYKTNIHADSLWTR